MKTDEELMNRAAEVVTEDFGRRLQASWCVQEREERKLRLRAVIELSSQYNFNVKTQGVGGSSSAEQAIESIIEGDWEDAKANVGDLDDPDRTPELRGRWLFAQVHSEHTNARKPASGAQPKP